MTSLILSFGGASRDAVIGAFDRIISGQSVKILALARSDEEELRYREFDGTLDVAFASLAAGTVCSIQVDTQGESMLLGGVYCPKFCGGVLNDWSGTIEGLLDNALELFEALLGINGLGYVALSKEESPDFETAHVTHETFPRSDWRVLRSAARDSSGEWVVCSGVLDHLPLT